MIGSCSSRVSDWELGHLVGSALGGLGMMSSQVAGLPTGSQSLTLELHEPITHPTKSTEHRRQLGRHGRPEALKEGRPMRDLRNGWELGDALCMYVPVARVGAVLSEWRRVSLTGRYTYTCSFYRETEVVWKVRRRCQIGHFVTSVRAQTCGRLRSSVGHRTNPQPWQVHSPHCGECTRVLVAF